MISKFHEVSRKQLLKSISEIRTESSGGLRSAAEIIQRFSLPALQLETRLRETVLRGINQRRRLVADFPKNSWHIYELCKQVYELAEIDKVDFNGAALEEKLSLIKQLVHVYEVEIINQGVMEYHESRIREGWVMRYKQNQDDISERIVHIPEVQTNCSANIENA